MEKKSIEFSKRMNVVVRFDDQDIEVKPFLGLVDQTILINRYLENYFNPENSSVTMPKHGFFDAENQLKVNVIETLTNVDLTNADLIEVLASGLFERVIGEVGNWGEFKALLYQSVKIVEKEQELAMSLGSVVDGFAKTISEFLAKLNALSPEEIKSAGEAGSKLLKEIENSPASSLFQEAAKNEKVL